MEALIRPPEGVLPAPSERDLPPAPRLRALLGPGVILAGLSLGSGEFVLWPRLTAEWGFAVFWAAWIGVTIQFFLNMEIERYTLATGESAVTGFLRLSRVFGPIFLICGSVPWIWPGWATGAATLISWDLGGDITLLAIGGLIGCGAVLSLGPVVYRTVELIQFVLVGVIFTLLVVLCAVVVRADALSALLKGAVRIGHIPDGIDLPLLLGALAFAGAGGTVNLAQSNYIKDKGYAMGRWIGRITSPFTGKAEAISEVGVRFSGSEQNVARWRVWWRLSNLEHFFSFYVVCVVCLALLCLLTYSLLEPGSEVAEGLGFIRAQADALETRFGGWARTLFLVAGIAILVSTELALLDAVTRVLADIGQTIFQTWGGGEAPFGLSALYMIVLWGLVGFGVMVLALGMDQPLTMLILSACLNGLVMFLYSGLLLWLNLRSFRGPLRPHPVRCAALLLSLAFFGYFSVLTLHDRLAQL